MLKRTSLALPDRAPRIDRSPAQPRPDFQPNPYEDYGRFLTAEGGVLIIYKDLDLRFRHTAWRMMAWTLFTGLEGSYLYRALWMRSPWVAAACFVIVATINWWIVAPPVQVYRRIEIRPDCLILDGTDIFWSRFMEGGFPGFQPDAEGNQVLCGTYGTRFVEYLVARCFDGNDRMPQVMAAHITEAMTQLWTRPFHTAG